MGAATCLRCEIENAPACVYSVQARALNSYVAKRYCLTTRSTFAPSWAVIRTRYTPVAQRVVFRAMWFSPRSGAVYTGTPITLYTDMRSACASPRSVSVSPNGLPAAVTPSSSTLSTADAFSHCATSVMLDVTGVLKSYVLPLRLHPLNRKPDFWGAGEGSFAFCP